jgi:NAD(P)-dependent dehydrogenase (short-subunit alcohol dehydrogenase family)
MDNVPNMSGKVCLITGATNGIGLVTARTLAQAGANVVLIGRDPEKTERVAQEIQSQAGSAKVEYLVGDLSAQDEVRRLAKEFRQEHTKLHVLINNAGAFVLRHQLSRDGIEMTFALNHLAYFLLTNLLLGTMIISPPARIINVSSAAHVGGKVRFKNLKDPQPYRAWRAYSQSKLANLYFTYELARRLLPTRITVNAVHPGFVATNFGRSNGGIYRPLFRLLQLVALSPEKGAQTSIYLASSPEVEDVTGKYFVNCKAVKSSPVSYDVERARRLWDVSAKMTGLAKSESIFP